MSRQTVEEINRLTARLEGQSARVLRQVEAAARSLTEIVSKEGVERLEEEIDREEVFLEEKCLRVMALHHPIGTDLRFLATLLRANGDLERAADHAWSAFSLSRTIVGQAPESLVLLSRRSAFLMAEAVRALLERNPLQAASVLEGNSALETLSETALRQARVHALSGEGDALDQAFVMVRVAMDFRRIGDLAFNLAENALFLERGNIVRHGGGGGPQQGF